jgi:type IV pilus assembly protein PilM
MSLFFPKLPAIGVDLSDQSIKVAQVKKRRSGLVVSSLGEQTIPAGFIDDGVIIQGKEGEIAQIIKNALKTAKGKIKINKAICSLPEENSFIKVFKIPRTENKDIEDIIRWQIESNFPVKLKDIYFDWQIIDVPKSKDKIDSELLSVCVAVVPQKIVSSYLSILEQAGLEPIAFEVESMSAVRGLIRTYTEKPVVILDMGKCGTGLSIFSGETILFTSHIEISGQRLTEAISKALSIDIKDAEIVKKIVGLIGLAKNSKLDLKIDTKTPTQEIIKDPNYSKFRNILNNSKEVEQVFSALVPVLTDFSEQIQHYIEYFSDFEKINGIPSGNIDKIILCGGESKLIGIADFISESLKINVEIGNPLQEMGREESLKGLSSGDFLEFATAIGLAIRGAKNNF